MSILSYLKPVQRLPTPSEAGLPDSVTADVNQIVEKVLSDGEKGTEARRKPKRKYTTSFSPKDRAVIGKYAAENGNAAAVKKFKTTHDVGESTVRLFKKKYCEEVQRHRIPGTEFKELTSLPERKRGRKVMLGEQLDGKVQAYIKALRGAGTPIGSNIVMAAAEGIVRAYDRTLLVDHGGTIAMTKTWALSLLGRMGYVKRKSTTKATLGMSDAQFEGVKARYLKQISKMVVLREIPESLIINLDQTGIKLVPNGDWTMAQQGSRRIEVVGIGEKRQITATFAAAMDGTFLPMQVLYQGKTTRCHPKYAFPDGFDIFHTPNHWANEETCIRFFEKIIFPYINKIRTALNAPSQKAMVIMDNFSGQTTPPVLEKLEEENIILVMVPPGTTDRLQPLDVSTNKSAKDFLREKF